MPFYYNGLIPKRGFGPIGLDLECIVLKPETLKTKFRNIPAEISLVSGIPDFKCFMHAFIYHDPDIVHRYNTWIHGINEIKLRYAPSFNFVRDKLKSILFDSNPILVGSNIKKDLELLHIQYDNYFDLQSFFYELNDLRTGYQPISLRRIVKKFFNIDVQAEMHNCTTDAIYSVKIYEEIYLKWDKISGEMSLDFPPFENNVFEKFN